MSRLLIDSTDGIAEHLIHDEASGAFHIERTQDVEPTLDAVAAEHSATGGKSDGLWHVGSVPMVILVDYAKKRGLPDHWALLRPEYASELMALVTGRDFRRFSPTEGKA